MTIATFSAFLIGVFVTCLYFAIKESVVTQALLMDLENMRDFIESDIVGALRQVKLLALEKLKENKEGSPDILIYKVMDDVETSIIARVCRDINKVIDR